MRIRAIQMLPVIPLKAMSQTTKNAVWVRRFMAFSLLLTVARQLFRNDSVPISRSRRAWTPRATRLHSWFEYARCRPFGPALLRVYFWVVPFSRLYVNTAKRFAGRNGPSVIGFNWVAGAQPREHPYINWKHDGDSKPNAPRKKAKHDQSEDAKGDFGIPTHVVDYNPRGEYFLTVATLSSIQLVCRRASKSPLQSGCAVDADMNGNLGNPSSRFAVLAVKALGGTDLGKTNAPPRCNQHRSSANQQSTRGGGQTYGYTQGYQIFFAKSENPAIQSARDFNSGHARRSHSGAGSLVAPASHRIRMGSLSPYRCPNARRGKAGERAMTTTTAISAASNDASDTIEAGAPLGALG